MCFSGASSVKWRSKYLFLQDHFEITTIIINNNNLYWTLTMCLAKLFHLPSLIFSPMATLRGRDLFLLPLHSQSSEKSINLLRVTQLGGELPGSLTCTIGSVKTLVRCQLSSKATMLSAVASGQGAGGGENLKVVSSGRVHLKSLPGGRRCEVSWFRAFDKYRGRGREFQVVD